MVGSPEGRTLVGCSGYGLVVCVHFELQTDIGAVAMTTMNITAIPENPTREDALRHFFSQLRGKHLPINDDTAEVYAHVIAAMYGPALKELEKR